MIKNSPYCVVYKFCIAVVLSQLDYTLKRTSFYSRTSEMRFKTWWRRTLADRSYLYVCAISSWKYHMKRLQGTSLIWGGKCITNRAFLNLIQCVIRILVAQMRLVSQRPVINLYRREMTASIWWQEHNFLIGKTHYTNGSIFHWMYGTVAYS